MTIINIRGTNGSGKTTLARGLAGPQASEVILTWYKQPRKDGSTYDRSIPGLQGSGVTLVGPYREGLKTGGCDGIKTQDLVGQAVEAAAPLGPVTVFEGIVISTIYERWAAFAKRRGDVMFMFLSTPLEECLRRIQQRNGGKDIKEDLVADKVRSIEATRVKLVAAGLPVHVLDWQGDPVAEAQEIIARA